MKQQTWYCGLLDTRRWIKSKNTLRLMLIHHRQKPTEVILNECLFKKILLSFCYHG
jgi:hypothetical protein